MAIQTSPYSKFELRELAAQLQRLLRTVEESVNWVENNKEPLLVFNKASQIHGSKMLRGFERELSDSLIAAQSGRPFTVDTLKPRANTVESNNDDAIIAKENRVLAKVAQKQAAKKKVARKQQTGRKKRRD